MECKDFRRMISRELDGADSGEERGILERHLSSCGECRRFRETSVLAASLHRGRGDASAPPGLLPAIMAAIEERSGARWFSGWIRFAVPAAAAALVVLGVLAGAFLTEITSAPRGGETEMLGLAYLDEHPPGSVGEALLHPAEEAGNER